MRKKNNKILQELEERRCADAELGGTNTSISKDQMCRLFLHHRKIAKDLQYKYIARKKDRRVECKSSTHSA